MEFTSPNTSNTSKIYLHVDNSPSMTTNWILTELLLYDQNCKKKFHVMT